MACHETCQKGEKPKDTIIEKPIKKIPVKKPTTMIQETMTTEDCNTICTNLRSTNFQEKENCMTSCTSEIQ